MKLILRLFFFLSLLIPSVLHASEKPLVLVMGEDSYPFQFLDDDGEPQGLLVELWKEWSRVNRRPVVFVGRVWRDSVAQLEEGRADVHLGMAINPEREAKFAFANAISDVNTYVYLHKQLQGRTKLEELQPFQIGIVQGSTFEQELSRRQPGLVFRYFPTRDTLLEAAYRGELVAFAGMEGYMRDQALQQKLAAEFPINTRVLVRETKLHPAVRQGNNALIREINEGFANVADDFVRKLERRWLGYQRQQSGLAIAMQLGVEPFVDLGGDGQPHGLYVDIWRLWSEKTGIPINFIPGDMNGSLEDVRSGRADVHIGYPESEDMNTGLYRAWHMYTIKSRLFLYGDQSHELDALKGKRLGVFPTAPYVAELKAALPDTQIRFYQGMDEMLAAVHQGDIVGFVAAAAWTQHYLLLNRSWSEFHQVPSLEFDTEIYALIRQGDQGLANRIASGFNMIDWKELADIEQKWMLNSRDHVFLKDKEHLELTDNQRRYLDGLGTLRMGFLENWGPMEFVDEQGNFAGVNSDIAQMIETMLGIEIQPVPFKEWSDLISALAKGNIDIAGSVAKTAEREGQLGYSDPYWPSAWALVSPLESVTVFNLEQLEGQRLAVVEGYQIISRLMAEYPGIKLVLVPDSQSGLQTVASGKADVFLEKVVTVASQLGAGQYQQLKMSLLADFADQKSHIAVSAKHTELLPFINRVIAKLDKARVQEIYSRWMDIKLDTGLVRYQRYMKGVAVALALLTLLVLVITVINRRLKSEIQARKEAESRIAHLASHDPLTGLPNRMLLDDRLKQATLFHCREQSKFALLFVDLDGFKEINDTEGHVTGDAVLVKVANLLDEAVRKSDTVARFGGDEFVVMLNKIHDLDSVCQVAETLIARIGEPLNIGKKTLKLSASIGIAIFPSDSDNPIGLMQKADKMMYFAKQAGGNGYRSA
ncbi:transporter substrate-binding domain-containing protein [Shewanella zhangzhouensis]|uniref:transporter substrate-binding domain-containing protein n=1 Tax=Shewanella zhangzhouensis TaxID=2864213 RepID=UPI001C65FB65|nr:transporter substrate-binding domain-containing protein [Shewanella zhangzhouensis]QYK03509.1 transporter substrate-binding domain-containing protein [Shewanella zhangzhouensis]